MEITWWLDSEDFLQAVSVEAAPPMAVYPAQFILHQVRLLCKGKFLGNHYNNPARPYALRMLERAAGSLVRQYHRQCKLQEAPQDVYWVLLEAFTAVLPVLAHQVEVTDQDQARPFQV